MQGQRTQAPPGPGGYESERLTALDWVRLGVGVIARIAFWVIVLFIVGNAVVQAATDDQWVLAFIEASFFPATFLIYPFAAAPDATARPFAEGTTFIPFLVTALIAYPVSTFVGGFDPID